MNNVIFMPEGDQGILINFGNEISIEINKQIRCVMDNINNAHIRGIVDTIPSYTSLLVLYDRHMIKYQKLEKLLRNYVVNINITGQTKSTLHYIPVCYEDKFALDLADVAEVNGLSKSDVIDIHTGSNYLIYMLGFMPGFVYLGGMDERIACPRLETPRTKIPAGGVGIGGKQTGIYPLESPGGWRILGQTPLNVYDPDRNPSILYEMGDYIRFVKISASEFDYIKEDVKKGNYRHKTEEVIL